MIEDWRQGEERNADWPKDRPRLDRRKHQSVWGHLVHVCSARVTVGEIFIFIVIFNRESYHPTYQEHKRTVRQQYIFSFDQGLKKNYFSYKVFAMVLLKI